MSISKLNPKTKTACSGRFGFTLIELLMVMAIIGVLASLAVGVLRGAQDDAREAATVSRISQMRTLLLDRLEEFEVRNVPADMSGYGIINQTWERAIAQRILADIFYCEMPTYYRADLGVFPSDNFTDWLNDYVVTSENAMTSANATQLIADLQLREPVMVDRIAYLSAGNVNFDTASEFLYQIMLATERDGQSGSELITNRGVDDVDEDGVLEIVDAWNKPMGVSFTYHDDNLPAPGFLELGAAILDDRVFFLEFNKIRANLISDNLKL